MKKRRTMYIPKIAIIGCGTAAQRYYVPVLRRHPGLKDRLYLVDTDRAGAEETRAALGGGTIREDFRDVLHEIQGAIIILPNHLHHPVAMECLGAGVSVLCEKPLAVLPGHAREMIQKARDQGAALCVNNTRRMFPSFREVREIIASGRLGRLESIEYVEGNVFGWPSATGFAVNPKISSRGILMDLGAHVADTICWWLGGRPVLKEMRDDSYGGPESVVRIKAEKDGCKIGITLSRLSDLSNRYQVTGDRGRISGRIFDWKRVSLKDENRAMSVRKLASVSRNYPGFAVPIVENFLQVIQGRAQPLISGSDVLDSIEFIHKCYERRERLDLSWDKKAWPRHAARGGLQVRKPGRILVTGATGFIGGRIVEMAHLAQGARYPVRAGVHQWSSAARLGRFPVETVSLDLTDPVRIEHALEGVTHVVHCAKGSPEVTVQGARNLLDASLKKGVSHVIHLSTADVYGDAAGIVDENSPYHYTGNPYNRMKIDAEKICWEYREKGLPITIF
ncbi:MAG: NAD-dependent epimerase/dehydratase family protein, partial [Desulfomonilia bacterium]|nr:NAD-dependent epimerase/dehydratase family protein [Desulfomonilia bacterium]